MALPGLTMSGQQYDLATGIQFPYRRPRLLGVIVYRWQQRWFGVSAG
ncbi:hypothetical protein [Haladaptatus sp. W1]|nr:hypothetical protein [Haladaptatus sp. W1]